MIGGVFKLLNEHGLPLETILQVLEDQGLVIDWENFIREAHATGWMFKTIISKFDEAILDLYPESVRTQLSIKLKAILQKICTEDETN